jgi:hypothetical protein
VYIVGSGRSCGVGCWWREKVGDLDEVNEWIKMKFCEKIEEVREKRVLAYWGMLPRIFPGIDTVGFVSFRLFVAGFFWC